MQCAIGTKNSEKTVSTVKTAPHQTFGVLVHNTTCDILSRATFSRASKALFCYVFAKPRADENVMKEDTQGRSTCKELTTIPNHLCTYTEQLMRSCTQECMLTIVSARTLLATSTQFAHSKLRMCSMLLGMANVTKLHHLFIQKKKNFPVKSWRRSIRTLVFLEDLVLPYIHT